MSNAFLSKGNQFDESIIDTGYDQKGNLIRETNDNVSYTSSGFSLIEENNDTVSYLLDFTFEDFSSINNATLRLYFINNIYKILT